MITKKDYSDSADISFAENVTLSATTPQAQLIIKLYEDCRDTILKTVSNIKDTEYGVFLDPPSPHEGSNSVERFDIRCAHTRTEYGEDSVLDGIVERSRWLCTCALLYDKKWKFELTVFRDILKDKYNSPIGEWEYKASVGNHDDLVRIKIIEDDVEDICKANDMHALFEQSARHIAIEYSRYIEVANCVKKEYSGFLSFYNNEVRKLNEARQKKLTELKEKVKIIMD